MWRFYFVSYRKILLPVTFIKIQVVPQSIPDNLLQQIIPIRDSVQSVMFSLSFWLVGNCIEKDRLFNAFTGLSSSLLCYFTAIQPGLWVTIPSGIKLSNQRETKQISNIVNKASFLSLCFHLFLSNILNYFTKQCPFG